MDALQRRFDNVTLQVNVGFGRWTIMTDVKKVSAAGDSARQHWSRDGRFQDVGNNPRPWVVTGLYGCREGAPDCARRRAVLGHLRLPPAGEATGGIAFKLFQHQDSGALVVWAQNHLEDFGVTNEL